MKFLLRKHYNKFRLIPSTPLMFLGVHVNVVSMPDDLLKRGVNRYQLKVDSIFCQLANAKVPS